MDILTFSSALESQMREKLKVLDAQSQTPDFGKASLAAKNLSVVGETINDLRQFVYKYKFKEVVEEIKFFKEVKPVFVSQYLYHKKVCSICLVEPYIQQEEKQKYLNTILKAMLRYTRRYAVYHQYTLSGNTSQDESYYTRLRMTNDPAKDILFSTPRSETLAAILSHALIRDYLRKLSTESTYRSKLIWTGKKTDLVELLFALHSAGSFNNGEAEVKEVTLAFEQAFNVQLGNQYDYLQKMRTRKSGQIAFIEKLKTSLRSRLDEIDQ